MFKKNLLLLTLVLCVFFFRGTSTCPSKTPESGSGKGKLLSSRENCGGSSQGQDLDVTLNFFMNGRKQKTAGTGDAAQEQKNAAKTNVSLNFFAGPGSGSTGCPTEKPDGLKADGPLPKMKKLTVISAQVKEAFKKLYNINFDNDKNKPRVYLVGQSESDKEKDTN